STTELYTLSLHDALPISSRRVCCKVHQCLHKRTESSCHTVGAESRQAQRFLGTCAGCSAAETSRRLLCGTSPNSRRCFADHRSRSEEHTSELQSLAYLVC